MNIYTPPEGFGLPLLSSESGPKPLRNVLFEAHIDELVRVAKTSTCQRSKCGAIIVHKSQWKIIGRGFNSMPCNVIESCFKDNLPAGFKSDKTCCVHAEQRAIIDAVRQDASEIPGSILYFIRLDEKGHPKVSGEPYCSICSKMALDSGVEYFALFQKNGWNAFTTVEYNNLTFKYNGQ